MDKDWQKVLGQINEDRQTAVTKQARQMEELLKRDVEHKLMMLVAGLVALMSLIGIIWWRVASSVTYEQCYNKCELNSIKQTDNRDCKTECAKYLKK